MESVFSQIGPWIFFLTLGSGMGIPLGIPPAPDDPVMARFAPARVRLLHDLVGQRGGQPGEQEPGRADAGRAGSAAVRRASGKVDPPLHRSDARRRPRRREQSLRRDDRCHALDPPPPDDPLRVGPEDQGRKVSAKGGMVVALGDDAAAATKLFHQNVREFFLNLNVQAVEVVPIDGQKWYRVKPKGEFPTMMVGIKDSYLIVAVGDGTLDMVLQRMQKPAPEWLVKARRIATIERPTGLTYINLQRLREVGPAATDKRRKEWTELLGLAQSPWLVSACGLVGPDVVTRTVLPIDGQPRGLLLPANGRGLKTGGPGADSRRRHAGAGRAAERA